MKMLQVLTFTTCLLAASSLASLKTQGKPFHATSKQARDWDCPSCQGMVSDLLNTTMSPESMAGQIDTLMVLCATEDPVTTAECEAGMPQWWTGIASLLWPAFFDAEWICVEECSTKKMAFRETCGDCMSALEYLEGILLSVEAEVQMVLFLDENYCPTQEVMDPQECKDTMPWFPPRAIELLLSDGDANDNHFTWCSEVHDA